MSTLLPLIHRRPTLAETTGSHSPEYIAVTIVTELIKLLAADLRKNKDDELFRREGTFFRGLNPPFDVLRTFKAESEFVNYEVSILPLVKSNQLGEQTNTIVL